MDHLSYANQLRAVGFDTLEHRRLRQDLLHTYKVLFGKLSIDHTRHVLHQVTLHYYRSPMEIISKLPSQELA